MNDPRYRLTKAEVGKVYDQLVKLAPPGSDWVQCPFCQREDWIVSDQITKIEAATHGWFPAILIICENCGYMAQLSAKTVGICEFDEGRSDG